MIRDILFSGQSQIRGPGTVDPQQGLRQEGLQEQELTPYSA